jgi:hypothetical protein
MSIEARRPLVSTHVVVMGLLTIAALANAWEWLVGDRMPLGDFPGYAAQIHYVRDALLEHSRVPRWCVECYGGTTNFTSHLDQYLALPFETWSDPVLAGKILTVGLRWLSAVGLYAVVVRFFGSPGAGLIAGYAYGFGAVANHQLEHLDMAVAAALMPPLLLASVALLDRATLLSMTALGALMALQLQNNWVYALPVPVAVALLFLLRPTRGRSGSESSGSDRQRVSRTAAFIAGSLLVFTVLSGSQVASVLTDAKNHRLASTASLASERSIYVERSPFLYVNRDNVLAGWLADHHPPGLLVAEWDKGRRYLGVVVLLIGLVGCGLARRDETLRRWAAVAGGIFVFQYWLSLGPTTLLWQVGGSLHWSDETQDAIAVALDVASIGCLLASGAAFALARRSARTSVAWGVRLGVAAALLALPAHSLWNGMRAMLPLLEVQRSPGHFFETAIFWLCLLFAVGLVAVERRFSQRRRSRWVLASVALLVVIDFWPSVSVFSAGSPMPPLLREGERVAALPGENGTLRIAMPRAYSPLTSWVVAQGDVGHVWGWLPWQSGRYWTDFVSAAVWRTGPLGSRADVASADDARALLALARIRYFLLPAEEGRAPSPEDGWRLVEPGELFSIWEQPDVGPMASSHGSYILHADPLDRAVAGRVARAAREQEVVVFPEAAWTEYRDGARETWLPGGQRIRGRGRQMPPTAVRYSRPSPEHIVLERESDEDSGMVFVSDGYHPWWAATVDGTPAPVLRAQLAFMAVPVEAGAGRIELRLTRPVEVAVADGVSTLGWVLLPIGVGVAGARRLRSRGESVRTG